MIKHINISKHFVRHWTIFYTIRWFNKSTITGRMKSILTNICSEGCHASYQNSRSSVEKRSHVITQCQRSDKNQLCFYWSHAIILCKRSNTRMLLLDFVNHKLNWSPLLFSNTLTSQISWHFLITDIIGLVTRRIPLVEQKLLIFLEHLSSSPVLSGVRVHQSLVFYEVFWRSLLFSFCPFNLAILLYVSVRYTASGYSFGNFKLFFQHSNWPFRSVKR